MHLKLKVAKKSCGDYFLRLQNTQICLQKCLPYRADKFTSMT